MDAAAECAGMVAICPGYHVLAADGSCMQAAGVLMFFALPLPFLQVWVGCCAVGLLP